MIFGKRKKQKHSYRFTADFDTGGNIEGETKNITLNDLNKMLCDMIDRGLEDIGVINLRVEVLEDDHSM